MKRPFVTLVLAAGKGTRMGSSDTHKVCFKVLGTPVIVRALETFLFCGAQTNVVVVGQRAESVMAAVSGRFPDTLFAFQNEPRGTGHAARCGAALLERMRYDGDVLVVAGDKVIEPSVIRRLTAAHQRCGADVTLAMARRPAQSSAGILLQSARGRIVGILEEAERQRLVGLGRLGAAFADARTLSTAGALRVLGGDPGAKVTSALVQELWRGRPASDPLSREDFVAATSEDQRAGVLRVAGQAVPVGDLLRRFPWMNLSTYLFRAPVLFDALHRLRAFRPGQEEYLTDVFAILAARQPPARVAGCEVADPRDLMAFNNPQELLAIEAVCRQREGRNAVELSGNPPPPLATAAAWVERLGSPPAAVRRQLRRCYGEAVPLAGLTEVVRAFGERFGPQRPLLLVRSPGRINLLGRHIDHQGGPVNVLAINREIVLAAAPREDDCVTLANVNAGRFTPQSFRIADLVANLDWDDWQRVVDGPRLQRLLDAARGDWANYAKAAVLRLQEQFRDRRLRGLDVVVGGDIPMGAGLSSSSALVVAVAEAVTVFNGLPVTARQLVSLCGEGEWFVGTRGGAADHAAIKLARRGSVTRVEFFPFRAGESAPFFPDHDLVVCDSGLYAGKSHAARDVFNQKVTAYHLGRVWARMLRPELAPRLEHLRDLLPERSGLSRAALADLLRRLPARLTRAQAQAAFPQMPEADRARLTALFASHNAPPAGYPVREVVVFGLSEMARARRCLDLLRAGDAAGLGRLMNLSHDGDRVSRRTADGRWRREGFAVTETTLRRWTRARGAAGELTALPGAYGCSLPELDRIADFLRRHPGVAGAQLAGAGLGGCVMALVAGARSTSLLTALREQGIKAEVFRSVAGACVLEPD